MPLQLKPKQQKHPLQPQQPNLRLTRQELGKAGEDYASRYLQSNGFVILDRNFKARYGEIDIVALSRSPKILVFVEVKTRVGRDFGLPEESVTPRKLREIIKTAQYYVLKHPGVPDAQRIDVIGIEYDEKNTMIYFNHIQNVTL